jgi:hypothetical protein
LRTEDKEIDGRELARHVELEQSRREKEDAEELPHVLGEQARDLAPTVRGELCSAVQAILAREHVVIDMLRLPAHEQRALEALQEAVDGRDAKLHRFVFASDRRDLLEQALAMLQPNLALDARAYHSLVARVGELRHQLANLEDSQDELIDGSHHRGAEKLHPESTPPSDTTDIDPDAPRPASTLDGPELAPAPTPSTTLGDPAEIAASDAARSAPQVLRRGGPATEPVPDAPPQPSTSTAKKPWWKRPFG